MDLCLDDVQVVAALQQNPFNRVLSWIVNFNVVLLVIRDLLAILLCLLLSNNK